MRFRAPVIGSGSSALRIVVLGYLVRGPIGGMAWSDLQYLLGLRALGHDVYFFEDSDDYPSCYDPCKDRMVADPTYGLRFARDVLGAFDLGERWGYFDSHNATWFGPLAHRHQDIGSTADVLLNLGGINPIRRWFQQIPVRVLVDKDPVFTQIRHLSDPRARERAAAHTTFFSFGENIGRGSAVPDDRFPWQPTRHPIALAYWPVVDGVAASSRFTTVMQWDSYPAVEHGGIRYGLKSDSFGPFMTFPCTTGADMELAIGSSAAPRGPLAAGGWKLRDPIAERWGVREYQRYIQSSKAEFTVAKHGYVLARTGWFSERSASYLASGRPVVTEETGFSEWLPSGLGVMPFSGPDGAAAAVRDVAIRYDVHRRAARMLAEEYFDGGRVLAQLLERAVQ